MSYDPFAFDPDDGPISELLDHLEYQNQVETVSPTILTCTGEGLKGLSERSGEVPETVKPIAEECADCGHLVPEHNERGECFHYDNHGGCACCEFISAERATPEMRARRLFGRMWHSTYSLREAFNPDLPCMVNQCEERAVRRIMVNIWGSVAEYDVCEPHAAHWHGKNVDDFPVRRSSSQPCGRRPDGE